MFWHFLVRLAVKHTLVASYESTACSIGNISSRRGFNAAAALAHTLDWFIDDFGRGLRGSIRIELWVVACEVNETCQ